MTFLEKIIKDRMRRSITKDIFAVLFLSITWVCCKKIFQVLGDSHDYIRIGSIDLNMSLYTVAHYITYIVILIIITRRIIAAVDKYLYILLKGQIRKRFLFTKVINVIIYFISGLLFLDVLSVDTKIIATLSGAIGIGLGFGLQKIVSNFISGIILFVEQSVRIDDFIELKDNTTGLVKQMSARYTLLETSDGKEIFVPNEDLIVNKFINWTHNNNICREEFSIKISHDSDLDLALKIVSEQILLTTNLSKDHKSECLISGYDEFGYIFSIKLWLIDVKEHSNRLKSIFLLNVIKLFRLNSIQMPAQIFNIDIKK